MAAGNDGGSLRSIRAKAVWVLGGLAAASILTAVGDWRDNHAFLVNVSESLPNWGFLIQPNKVPRRGDYIFFAPPPSALLRRHFGEKPGPFGKIVYGLPGDIVAHVGRDVTVNGHVVARLKPLSRWAEKLVPGPTGRIPDGCYFVGTDHKDGFDSRYAAIGFICRRQIIGTGEPIL